MRPILFLFFLAFTFGAAAQKGFPATFVGHWQGEIAWYRQGAAEPRKFKMQLLIQPTDSAGRYTWKIIYGEKGEDTRPYELKAVDTATGHWMVDEKNGILLDQYFIGGKLYSVFSVGGTTIVNSYWREGDRLAVEFASFPAKAVRTSGAGTEESPTVESYAVRSYQKGILARVKPQQKLPLRKPKK
jgi:hypothetical protein